MSFGHRVNRVFSPVPTTAPGFSASFDNTSTVFALESTVRKWAGPSARTVRVGSIASDDFHINFGTSDIVAASSDSVLVLGGTIEDFTPPLPTYTHMACVSSTNVTINVSIGYGQ